MKGAASRAVGGSRAGLWTSAWPALPVEVAKQIVNKGRDLAKEGRIDLVSCVGWLMVIRMVLDA